MTRARLCLLTGLLLAACADGPAAATVADAAVLDLQGAPTDPLAGPPAAATVLLFVSTHCPISNRYAPTIRALAEAWAARGVRVWLIYPDPDDDVAAIRAHQAAYALELPTLRDPGHVLVDRAGVRVTPEAAVFAASVSAPAYRGRIDDRVQDFGKIRPEASAHELRDAVEAVLRAEAPRPAGGPAIGCYLADLR
jgi:hypothetical protein